MKAIHTSTRKPLTAYEESILTWDTALEQLSELGYELPEDVPTIGEWHRVPAAFKDSANLAAAVRIADDGMSVYLYDHVEGINHTVRGEYVSSLSSFDKRQRQIEIENRRLAEKAAIQAREIDAINNARRVFDSASPCKQHPYLKSKNVALPGCRGDGYWLFVPLTDIQGNIRSIQRIAPDGTKRLFTGAPLLGSAYRIGESSEPDGIYITEGAATGASVHQDTGAMVICSMAASNLERCACDIRKQYPDTKIIIAGDDDQRSRINVGRKKAIEAAEAVNGFILFPSFCESCDSSCTDHNDVAACKWRKS